MPRQARLDTRGALRHVQDQSSTAATLTPSRPSGQGLGLTIPIQSAIFPPVHDKGINGKLGRPWHRPKASVLIVVLVGST